MLFLYNLYINLYINRKVCIVEDIKATHDIHHQGWYIPLSQYLKGKGRRIFVSSRIHLPNINQSDISIP